MRSFLVTIRPDERRDVAAAAATLFGLMVGHALLETARDALFLAELPATHLPWLYIAIAAFVLLLGSAHLGFTEASSSPAALTAWLLAGGLGTLGLWSLLATGEARLLYVLYLWSGVLATLVVARFWSLLGDRYTVTQAKRLFAPVGAGGVLGAVAGSAAARALITGHSPRALLPAAATAFALTALAPLLFRRAPPRPRSKSIGRLASTSDVARRVWSRPYSRRVAALVLVTAFTVTLVDWLFKSAVARNIDTGDLGTFFATVYLVLNVASLAFLLGVTGWLLRTLGVNRSLIVLPVLIATGSLGVVLGGGLAAVLLLKGADGSLRHSLNRTASEILYVPLAPEERLPIKSFIDAAGQRGGQALAAVAILAVLPFATAEYAVAGAIFVTALLWAGLAHALRAHYLDLFRATLQEGVTETRLRFPELDLAALESLIEALNSANDTHVRAAIDLLAEEGRSRLIPALILYHPSPGVVCRALELFARARRTDFTAIADRLIEENPDDSVKTAALRARTAVATDTDLLTRMLEHSSAAVRATALVGLLADGDGSENLLASLDATARNGTRDARIGLARAIGHRPALVFDDALVALAASGDRDIQLAALGAIAEARRPAFVPPLTRLLSSRELRRDARAALVAIGPPALEDLGVALGSHSTPLAIRRHLPRTLRLFDPAKAAPLLLAHLLDEDDGVVRYKILRALGRLHADQPGLRLDATILRRATDLSLSAAFRVLAWRIALERGVATEPSRRTPVHELLVSLLADREVQAVERIFRLLGLRHPSEDFKRIHRGLAAADRSASASSRELIAHIVAPPLRAPLLSLLDDLPADARLARADAYGTAVPADYLETLNTMMWQQGNPTLRALTVYHIGELNLGEMRDGLETLREEPSFLLAAAIDRTLSRLDARPDDGDEN